MGRVSGVYAAAQQHGADPGGDVFARGRPRPKPPFFNGRILFLLALGLGPVLGGADVPRRSAGVDVPLCHRPAAGAAAAAGAGLCIVCHPTADLLFNLRGGNAQVFRHGAAGPAQCLMPAGKFTAVGAQRGNYQHGIWFLGGQSLANGAAGGTAGQKIALGFYPPARFPAGARAEKYVHRADPGRGGHC